MISEFFRVIAGNLSALAGWLAGLSRPAWLARASVRFYIWWFGVETVELSEPVSEFKNIGQFFVRELKSGVRPLGAGLLSPVDGTLRGAGAIVNAELEQIKGSKYSLTEFLGDQMLATRFVDGTYLNLYLSPRDYHHVHAPLSGAVVSYNHIPGAFWPVNQLALRVPGLFVRNERLVSYLNTEHGLVALVMVGAFNVSRLSVVYAELPAPPRDLRKVRPTQAELECPYQISAGDKFGTFHLGSTVVLLFEPGQIANFGTTPALVRYGQSIGTFTT